MKLLSEPQVSEESACPYIDGKRWRFSYFFALDVAAEELDIILSRGWRKFGMYYFRPVCIGCRECIPIRVKTDEMTPSKSQRRAIRDCMDIRVEFKDMEYRDEIFEIYKDHSFNRFNKESSEEDFRSSFYTKSCPALGYFIENNKSMAYKNSFHINEKMDWDTGEWLHEKDFIKKAFNE